MPPVIVVGRQGNISRSLDASPFGLKRSLCQRSLSLALFDSFESPDGSGPTERPTLKPSTSFTTCSAWWRYPWLSTLPGFARAPWCLLTATSGADAGTIRRDHQRERLRDEGEVCVNRPLVDNRIPCEARRKEHP